MALSVRFKAQFPAQVQGTNGFKVVQSGGVYTIEPDYGSLAAITSVSATERPAVFVPTYRTDTTPTYGVISIDTLLTTISAGLDPTLVAIAGLTPAADQAIYWTGTDTAALYSLTTGGRAIAGLVSGADLLPYFSGAGAANTTAFTAYGRGLVAVADEATFKALVNLEIGTDVQAYNANLASLSLLGTAADKLAYTTAADTWAEASLTSFARTLLADADGPSALTTLGAVPIAGGTMTGLLVLSADPSAALGAATKQYVDSVAAGLSVKPSVLVATTANITLSGEQTIDGILTSGSRVLVKNQTTTADNGIYVSGAGAWARASDMAAWSQVPGAFCFVEEGSTYADTAFVSTADPGGTLGTTAITWSQFAGAGTYTAGSGLTLTGTQFALDTSSNRNVDHTAVSISAGNGLSGGGDISATRTLTVAAGTGISVGAGGVALASIADKNILANISGASAAPSGSTLSAILDDVVSNAQGTLLMRDATGWSALAPGTSGYFLKTQGASADATWAAIPGGGNMLSTNNLSDVANAATAFGNIKQNASLSATGVVKRWTLAIVTATNASWPVPAGTSEMMIEVIGAGGSGGAGNTTASQRGSGGGGGAYAFKHYTGTIDSTLNITIGSGGAAVTSVAGGANGNAGGDTSVVGTNLGTITAGGGAAGLANVNAGGAGGTATGGDLNIDGEAGATSWSGTTLQAAFKGGSCYGGGFGGSVNVSTDGSIPGGGGSCGNHIASSPSGAGARGEVHVWTR